MKKYVSRTEYCEAHGHTVRNGGQGKCNDAWALFEIAHRNGVTDKETVFAAGAALGLNLGNLKTEWNYWCDANLPGTKMVRNLMSGKMVEIPTDTPFCCDPSTETYWSM